MRRNQTLIKLLLVLGVLIVGTSYMLPTATAGGPVQVKSADPPAAEQGTFGLDVTISGRNFDNSAAVRFFVTGTTNPGGVIVNSVAFINSKKLVATIDVEDLAVVDNFDIEVELLSSGRKGKGTEKFSVLKANSGGGSLNNTPVTITYRDDNTSGMEDRIQSDGMNGISPYSDGEEGVDSELSRGVFLRTHDGPRTLFLDFSDVVEPFNSSLIPGSPDDYPVFFMFIAPVDCAGLDDPASGCPDLDEGFRAITETGLARLVLNFPDLSSTDGSEYRLRMGPNIVGADGNFEEIVNLGTDHLVVSCTNLLNGSCTQWSVAVNAPNDIAHLYRFTPRQKKGIKPKREEVGDFHMPHELTITIKQ